MAKKFHFILAALLASLLWCKPASAALLTIQDFLGDTQIHSPEGIYSQARTRLIGGGGSVQSLDYERYTFGTVSADDWFASSQITSGSVYNPYSNYTAASVDRGKIRVDASGFVANSLTGAYALGQWSDWTLIAVPYQNNDPSTLPAELFYDLNLHAHAFISVFGRGSNFVDIRLTFESANAYDDLNIDDRLPIFSSDTIYNELVVGTSKIFDYIHPQSVKSNLVASQDGYGYYLGNYAYTAQSSIYGYGTEIILMRANGWNTFSIQSITLPDGSTPESNGYLLQFGSGMQSPNLAVTGVPEPSSLTLAGLGIVGLAGGAYRRRRKVLAPGESPGVC